MNELADSIKNLNNDEEFVLKIDARERALREYNAQMAGARREGLEQGLQQGKANAKAEVAKKMKEKGMPIDDIIDITGLSKEEIESL